MLPQRAERLMVDDGSIGLDLQLRVLFAKDLPVQILIGQHLRRNGPGSVTAGHFLDQTRDFANSLHEVGELFASLLLFGVS